MDENATLISLISKCRRNRGGHTLRKNKIVYKAITIILASTITLAAIAFVPNSFSCFKKSFENSAEEVVAATTKDIIDEFDIYYDEGQPILRLKRAEGLEYPPVIFFSVEGNIGDYVLNINPIKLEKDEAYEIPILPNVNLPQSISLALNLSGTTEGQIRIKHLNEFIDEPVEISISNKYLLKRYFTNKGLNLNMADDACVAENEKDALTDHIIKMIAYTSEYIKWEEAKWEEYDDIPEDPCTYHMPISRMEILPYQSRIVDEVAPNLLEYNEKLYSLLENMIAELNSLSYEKQELTLENERISEENKKLLEINKNLEEIIANLSTQIAPAPKDPKTEDPAQEDPVPENPASEDPALENPAPKDPAPKDPAPADLAPENPAPKDPTPEDPAAEDPAPKSPTTSSTYTDENEVIGNMDTSVEVQKQP